VGCLKEGGGHPSSLTPVEVAAYAAMDLKWVKIFFSVYLCGALFFNQGSASGCQGFRRNRLNVPGTKFGTTVLCGL